jgi:dolichol kinase
MKNPGRKLYHVLGGLGLLGVYLYLGPRQAFPVYLLLLAGILVFDLTRLRHPGFGAWAMKNMGSLLRPGEAATISGSPAYVLGVALTLYLFDLPIATAAVLFLIFGDVCASIIGEQWGKTKFRDKSLEGTAAFVVAGLAAALLYRLFGETPPFALLACGVVTAAIVEIFTPRRLNDNLTIPLAAAAIMTILGKLAG